MSSESRTKPTARSPTRPVADARLKAPVLVRLPSARPVNCNDFRGHRRTVRIIAATGNNDHSGSFTIGYSTGSASGKRIVSLRTAEGIMQQQQQQQQPPLRTVCLTQIGKYTTLGKLFPLPSPSDRPTTCLLCVSSDGRGRGVRRNGAKTGQAGQRAQRPAATGGVSDRLWRASNTARGMTRRVHASHHSPRPSSGDSRERGWIAPS